MDAIEQLNSVKYIYLRNLSEPRDNSLKIVVEEAVLNKNRIASCSSPIPELQNLFADAHLIESIEGCKVFELYWKHYAAYCVTEELVGSNAQTGYDDESYEGKILRSYTKSHFLDHIQRDTGGHVDGIVQHYKLICLNHLIDIAACEPPQVRLLGFPNDLFAFEGQVH